MCFAGIFHGYEAKEDPLVDNGVVCRVARIVVVVVVMAVVQEEEE